MKKRTSKKQKMPQKMPSQKQSGNRSSAGSSMRKLAVARPINALASLSSRTGKASTGSTMPVHQARNIFVAMLGTAVLALLISGYLYCKHLGICQSSFACALGTDGVDGCRALGESNFSRLLGIPIAWFGMVYYATLAILVAWMLIGRFIRSDKMSSARFYTLLSSLFLLIEIGVGADLILATVNIFVLPVICLLCLYTYICQLVLMILSIWMYRHFRSDLNRGNKFFYAWWPAFLLSLLPALVLMLWANGKSADLALDAHAGHGHSKQGEQSNVIPLIDEERVEPLLRELRAFAKKNAIFGKVNTKSSAFADNATEESLKSFQGQPYVQFIEFVDFLCGYCFRFHLVFEFLQQRWPGRLQVENRFFPLDGSCNAKVERKGDGASCYGTLTSYCVADLEPSKYNKYYDELFQLQRRSIRISRPIVRTIAGNLGLNFSQIDGCSTSPRAYDRLKADLELSNQIGVSGTPTILLNGHVLGSGLPNVRWLIGVVDALVLQKEGQAARDDFSGRHGSGSANP